TYRKPIFEYRDYNTQANVFLNQTTKLQLGNGVGQFPYSGLSAFSGNSIIMGDFYEGTTYPAKYQNALFFADFIGKWIRVMTFDANNEPAIIEDFMQLPDYITGVTYNPIDEAMYYVTGNALPCDQIRRVIYSPSNAVPIAKIEVDTNNGIAPLAVAFNARKSYDPEATPLTYEWSIDDNSVFSNGLAPHYLFTPSGNAQQVYKVKLKVTDQNGAGLSATDSVYIYANNTPPTISSTSLDNITSIPPNQSYSLNLSAIVADAQTSANDLTLSWTVVFAHNGHEHKDPILTGNNINTTLAGAGCEVGDATYWYKVYLKVTDPQGLSETIIKNIELNCLGSSQTLSFPTIANREITLNTSSSVTAFASSSAGLTPLYYFNVAGPAYTIDNQIKLTGKPGKITIRAVQHGNGSYKPALPVDQTFDVDRNIVHYTMNFDTITNKLITDIPFTISASTAPTQEVPVFMLISGPATISGSTISLTGEVGTVKIRAYFEGNYGWSGAYMDRTFNVLNPTPPITQDEIIYGDSLKVNWQNFSTISSLDISNDALPFISSKSIKVTNPTVNETLDLRYNGSPFNTVDFPDGFEFWVYNNSSVAYPLQVEVFTTNSGGGSSPISIMADANKWTRFLLDWSLFGSPAQVGKILIRLNQTQAESLYFDEIKLVHCADMSSTKTGNWDDPTVWNCGRLPISTDIITISPSHTVTVLNGVSATLRLLQLLGTLNMESGAIFDIKKY
ncbi:MAG: PKD domain-containing protein, partial [Bacteroidota bacterium]